MILLAGVAPYLNTLSVPFVFDDRVTIVNEDAIKDLGKIWRVLLADTAGEIRPLVSLSFALNYAWGELNVFGYHVVNIFIHVLNGVLVYFIADLLVKLSPADEVVPARYSPILALFIALLFVSHPVQTEAVTYIWGRSDLLCAFFYFASFLFYGKAREAHELASRAQGKKGKLSQSVGKTSLYYYGALALFIFGLGTKAVILSLPLLLCAFDYWFVVGEGSKPWWRERFKRLLPFFLAAGIRLYLHYSFQKPDIISALRDNLVWQERPDLLTNMLMQCQVVVHYLALLAFPVSLNIDHDVPVARSVFEGSVLLGFGVLVGLVGLAFFLRQRSYVASFGVVWLVLPLSFYFLFPLPDLLVERRLYLPSLGFFISLVVLLQLLAKRLGAMGWSETLTRVIRFSPVALVFLWAVMTVQRNTVWNDPYALWSEAASQAPTKARPHSNLAIVSLEQKKFEQAVAEAQRALLIDPASAEGHYALLDACVRLGWWGPAVGHFSQMLQTHPYYAVQWYNWRHQELQDKRALFLRLFSTFERNLATTPGNAEGHISLGFLYASLLGDEQRALVHFEEGLKFPSPRFRQQVILRIVQDLKRRASQRQQRQRQANPQQLGDG